MVVTGGEGFIGRNVLEILEGESSDLKSGQDIRNLGDLCDSFVGSETVIHLAASPGVPQSIENPQNDFEHNVIGTWNVLEAARQTGIQRVIFASSGSVKTCKSPYAAGKASGEAFMKAYLESYDIQTLSLRFSNVYGPFSEHKTSVVANMLKGEVIDVKGSGYQTRDFIHVWDVADAIEACIDSDVTGVLNIASGVQTSINQIAYAIAKRTGKEVIHSAPSKGDVRSNEVSITRTKQNINWHPRVDLWEGLDRLIDGHIELEIA
jgi:UDP-glucose 4-epimerase